MGPVRIPKDSDEVVLYLAAGDAGDGNAQDFVVWERPRLVAPGRPDVLLRDVRAAANASYGLDPALFGKHPGGDAAGSVEAASLCVQAPSVIEVRLPADLAAGAEFVTAGTLHAETGREGSVQLQILTTKPEPVAGLQPTAVAETNAGGPWTSNNRGVSHATPILVADGSAARRRFEAAFADFRTWFPTALCYTKIVPVDEVVTLTLFYREDDHLRRLMLDDAQAAQLDRLWDELHFVSLDALKLVDAFEQLWQYATQDADPKVFEPLRQPIQDRAVAFRRQLSDAEPRQLAALLEFAAARLPAAVAGVGDACAERPVPLRCVSRNCRTTRRSGWCSRGCSSRRRFSIGPSECRPRRRASHRRPARRWPSPCPISNWRRG